MKILFKKIDNFVYHLERTFISCALIVMSVVVFVQVVLRYVFSQGLPWAEELARYLMVWAGFMGASIATRNRRHIKIDILPRLLGSNVKAKNTLIRLASLISAGFCFFLVKVGFDLVKNTFKFGRVSSTMELPMWIVQMGIPVTAFVIACRFLGQAFGEIKEESEIDRLLEQESKK